MNSVFPAIVDWSLLAYDPPGWGRALFFGLLNTLQIAVCGYLLGLLLGVCGAAGKLYGSPVIKDLLAVYTTVVRGIPELVLLLILYYAGTQFLNTIMAKLGYGSVDVSGLVAGIIVIGLVQGAYATEVIRGAILAIAPGQIEAGRAFGMSPIKVMHRITLPAMLPFAIPGLSNLWRHERHCPSCCRWLYRTYTRHTSGGWCDQSLYVVLPYRRRNLSGHNAAFDRVPARG